MNTDVREWFALDTKGHEITILMDAGLYRHVRFRNPGYSAYWFDLVTWPGVLAIHGDMGAWTFSRIEDMFSFFRHKEINPGYWAEKIRAGASPREYSEAKFRRLIWEQFDELVKWDAPPRGLGDALREELRLNDYVAHEDGARRFLEDFEHQPAHDPDAKPWRFEDAWEWDLTDWSHPFLWCCHAIRWGVEQYDKAVVTS